MSEEIRVLAQILKALCAIQEETWIREQRTWIDKQVINKDTYNIFEELISNWVPLTGKDTESFIPANCKSLNLNLFDTSKVIYLSPTIKQPHLVPVVTLECISNKQDSKIGIRIILVQRRNDLLEGIGFRFENGAGPHSHYHAQLIKELPPPSHKSKSLVKSFEWLPESEPVIPVKASNTITLFLCALISLYGFLNCAKLVTDYEINELKKYLEHFRT